MQIYLFLVADTSSMVCKLGCAFSSALHKNMSLTWNEHEFIFTVNAILLSWLREEGLLRLACFLFSPIISYMSFVFVSDKDFIALYIYFLMLLIIAAILVILLVRRP